MSYDCACLLLPPPVFTVRIRFILFIKSVSISSLLNAGWCGPHSETKNGMPVVCLREDCDNDQSCRGLLLPLLRHGGKASWMAPMASRQSSLQKSRTGNFTVCLCRRRGHIGHAHPRDALCSCTGQPGDKATLSLRGRQEMRRACRELMMPASALIGARSSPPSHSAS